MNAGRRPNSAAYLLARFDAWQAEHGDRAEAAEDGEVEPDVRARDKYCSKGFRHPTKGLGDFIRFRVVVDVFGLVIDEIKVATDLSDRQLNQGQYGFRGEHIRSLLEHFSKLPLADGGRPRRRPTREYFFHKAATIAELENWLVGDGAEWECDPDIERPEDGRTPPEFSRTLDELRAFAESGEGPAVATLVGPPATGKTLLLSCLLGGHWRRDRRRPVYIDCRSFPAMGLLAGRLVEKLSGTTHVATTAGEQLERLTEILVAQPAFLVLDNFDLAASDATPGTAFIRADNYVAALLEAISAAPHTRLLVASQASPPELLGLAAETGQLLEFRIPERDARAWVAERWKYSPYSDARALLEPILESRTSQRAPMLALRVGAMILAQDKSEEAQIAVRTCLDTGRIRHLLRYFLRAAGDSYLQVLRTIAAAEDGCRTSSLLQILQWRHPDPGPNGWTEAAVDAHLKRLMPLTVRIGRSEAQRTDLHDHIRHIILDDWRHRVNDQEDLRQTHRAIARVAWRRHVAMAPDGAGSAAMDVAAESFRLVVQTYVHLLASVDPARDVFEPTDPDAEGARQRFEAGEDLPQDRLAFAFEIITKRLEGTDNSLSRRFGADHLKLDLYLRWFFIGRLLPPAPIDEVVTAPSQLESLAPPKGQAEPERGLFDDVYEKAAIASLRSHQLGLCAHLVQAGLRRVARRDFLESTRLRLIEIDQVVRKGWLEYAELLAEQLQQRINGALLSEAVSWPPRGAQRIERTKRLLRHFGRSTGRLAQIHDLRGEPEKAYSTFRHALMGFDQCSNYQTLATCPELEALFVAAPGVNILWCGATTWRALLEFSVRQLRLESVRRKRGLQSVLHDKGWKRGEAVVALQHTLELKAPGEGLLNERATTYINASLRSRFSHAELDFRRDHVDRWVDMLDHLKRARRLVWDQTVNPMAHFLWVEEWARMHWHLAGLEVPQSERAVSLTEQAARITKRVVYFAREKRYALHEADALLLLAEIYLTAPHVSGAEFGAEEIDAAGAALDDAGEIIEARGYDFRLNDWRVLSDAAERKELQPCRTYVR